MPAGSEVILAGAYTVTYDGTSIGIFVGEDGFPVITQKELSKPIGPTSRYGRSKADSVQLGLDFVWAAVLLEAGKGMPALTPYAAFGVQPLVGTLKYSYAKALVMTAVAGTPAAATPATLTASKAILADGHEGKLMYGPDVRQLALALDLLPYILSGSTVGNFSTT